MLREVSLPSIRAQACPPVFAVIVTDGFIASAERIHEWKSCLGNIELKVLPNRRTQGVAGAWNTGLEYLLGMPFEGYVAILDDDDIWDSNHLEENLRTAAGHEAEVVISGLRMAIDGAPIPRKLIRAVSKSDFLMGNPGWQGSNTFVTLNSLAKVGGFRDGLQSLNDRDLAIRILRMPNVRIAFTGKWTATWNVAANRPSLSKPRSEAKLRGLRQFWQIYADEMEKVESESFFDRAEALFGFHHSEIHCDKPEIPVTISKLGDLVTSFNER